MPTYNANFKTVVLTPVIYDYLRRHTSPPTRVQAELIERTLAVGRLAAMQVPQEEGSLLTLLTQLVNARNAIEVGTFTGYSALAIALGLAPGGTLITCDRTAKWREISTAAWTAAGVAERIDFRLGPALDTIRALPPSTVFDLAFIDADKETYVQYWAELVPRVRPGGVIVADNVLFGGDVVRENAGDLADAIRVFNETVLEDDRVTSVILPVGDGVTVARKI